MATHSYKKSRTNGIKTNHEDRFLESVNVKMRESNQFLVEDFRRLQINPKFQESLKMALYIIKW